MKYIKTYEAERYKFDDDRTDTEFKIGDYVIKPWRVEWRDILFKIIHIYAKDAFSETKYMCEVVADISDINSGYDVEVGTKIDWFEYAIKKLSPEEVEDFFTKYNAQKYNL